MSTASGRDREPTASGSAASGAPPVLVQGLYSFQIGGSEKLGALLAREFAARGYRVLALSFFDADGPVRAELEAAGVGCHGLDVLGRPRWRRFTLRAELRRWFARHGATVVHLHHGVTAIRGVHAARDAGVDRVVVTEHSRRQLASEPAYRRRVREVLREVDAVTVVNDELREYAIGVLDVPAARVAVIGNAVDPGYARLRERVPRAPGDAGFVVGFVGRLVVEKDLGTLLRAFAAAAGGDACWRLRIAGDGPERASLVRAARALGIDGRVEWLGAQPDARALLAGSDVFAMSSISEGLPMALLEAMTAGVPCVATEVGGIGRALGGGRGLLVPPREPMALARALRRLHADPALRRELAARGVAAVAADYGIESVVERYLAIYGLPARWGRVAA